jgi:hypothetical protein
MAAPQLTIKIGLLELLKQIQSQYGLVVLVLVLLLAFVCWLLWALIWKVWSGAMTAKDNEIDRVSKERDKYQALVFERLRSSEVPPPKDKDNGKDGSGKSVKK